MKRPKNFENLKNLKINLKYINNIKILKDIFT